jgi:flagellar basal body-associated protein FliL
MKNKIIKIIIVVMLLIVLFYIGMSLFFKKEAKAPTNENSQNQNLNEQNQTSTFRGPTGKPFIIGPTGPPPKY